MNDIVGQMKLALPRKGQEIDIELVRRQPTMTRAIVLCADAAGFKNDKDLCRVIDVDPAVWARIKNGQAHFPQDRYEQLMNECGNDAPLIWLADRRGFILTPKETEMERRVRVADERALALENENRILREVLNGRGNGGRS